jgi:hypothetical protein
MLLVPYSFEPSVVKQVVIAGRPGAYALGHARNGAFGVGYVGRSDTCLRTRLVAHNYLWQFDYFLFRYAADPEAAFYLECEFWHAYGTHLCNVIHPATPGGSSVQCQYCGFAETVSGYFDQSLA